MKKWLFLFVLLGSGLASADVRIDDVIVRRKGGGVNIRVNLTNPSGHTQRGPIRITLYARPDSSSEWEQVKVWNNITKLAPGNRVARDFFDQNNSRLKEIATYPAFEARAVVEAPGCASQEETGVVQADP